MARVEKDHYQPRLHSALREMDFTGKPMQGYVYVEAPGLRSDGAVALLAATLPGVCPLPPRQGVQRESASPLTTSPLSAD